MVYAGRLRCSVKSKSIALTLPVLRVLHGEKMDHEEKKGNERIKNLCELSVLCVKKMCCGIGKDNEIKKRPESIYS